VARRVREDLALLGHGIEVFGPIHRDLTLGNLLFGARTGRVGVTDFDQCGLGHHLFDLSVVLRSLLRSWRRAGRPEGTLERAQEARSSGATPTSGACPRTTIASSAPST
jgi:Ser/Thr protein kinase RdoA (MazF antagonist)